MEDLYDSVRLLRYTLPAVQGCLTLFLEIVWRVQCDWKTGQRRREEKGKGKRYLIGGIYDVNIWRS
jgi:hypothetical protein